MATQTQQSGQLWSIVLAAGDGTGVDPFVFRWLGRPMPKEYCAFVGGRSMFQHALDRAVQMTPSERLVAVVAREHRQEAFHQLDRRSIGALLLQSIQQGTAASVFLSLTYVRERDPEGTVAVFLLITSSTRKSDSSRWCNKRFLSQSSILTDSSCWASRRTVSNWSMGGFNLVIDCPIRRPTTCGRCGHWQKSPRLPRLTSCSRPVGSGTREPLPPRSRLCGI